MDYETEEESKTSMSPRMCVEVLGVSEWDGRGRATNYNFGFLIVTHTGSTYYVSVPTMQERDEWVLQLKRCLECVFANPEVVPFKPSKILSTRPPLGTNSICPATKNIVNRASAVHCRCCGLGYYASEHVNEPSTVLQISVEEAEKVCLNCRNAQAVILWLKSLNYIHTIALHESTKAVLQEVHKFKASFKLRRRLSARLELAADLLDGIDLMGVLDPAIALIFRADIALVAALLEHPDDLVIGDGRLDQIFVHLVEFAMDVVDAVHEVEHPLGFIGGIVAQRFRHAQRRPFAAHLAHVQDHIFGQDTVLIGGLDIVGDLLRHAVADEALLPDRRELEQEHAHVGQEAQRVRPRFLEGFGMADDPGMVEMQRGMHLDQDLDVLFLGIGRCGNQHFGGDRNERADIFHAQPRAEVDILLHAGDLLLEGHHATLVALVIEHEVVADGGGVIFFDERMPLVDLCLIDAGFGPAPEGLFADDLDALKLLAAESDDQALRVKWVRWVPTTPLRVQDVVAKYGRWDAGGLSDDGFRLYRSWDARGITALLSEDEQSVLMMDFVFTEDEQREAFMRRYGQVPSWLRPGAGGGTTAAPGATPRFMPAP